MTISKTSNIVVVVFIFSSMLQTQLQADETLTPVICQVIDVDSKESLACRVYVESDKGKWYFAKSNNDEGSAIEYNVERSPISFERHTTVSAHPFTFRLPPGKYKLTAERGKEYQTETVSLTVRDRPVIKTIRLKRWINMAELGWYSGDTHVHRSLNDLPNVMQAEDLNVALPLSYWVRDAYTPPSRGDKSTTAKAKLIHVDNSHVIWPMNTEYEIFTVNRKRHTLGAVFVLNHKTPLKPAAPPVAPIAAEARQQQALLDLDKHSWPWSMMLVPIMNVDLFELSNNHIWRTQFYFKQWTLEQLPKAWSIETDTQGFTEWGWTDFGFKTYYALLNCGFKMRPTAGTASGVHPVPLGFGRVYVHLPDGFSYDKWIAGLDAGRSFVTTGPMLFATFDGQQPGTKIEFDKLRSIRIRGNAHSDKRISRIEIVKNGETVRTIKAQNEFAAGYSWQTLFDEQIEIDGTSWIAVRCFEKTSDKSRQRFAHTAPVHVNVPNRPLNPRKFETTFFINSIQAELKRNQDVLSDDELAEYKRALKIYGDLDAKATSD